MNQNRILYEDKDILVCHKPAGIATQTARVGQADMVSEMANYLAQGEKRPGIPYVGVVHRLDQPVEGILVFAKNRQAAADLSRQAAGDGMKKEYLALVCGKSIQRTGELTDYLLKDGKTNLSRVVPSAVKGAKLARLSYEVVRDDIAEILLPSQKENGGFSEGNGIEKDAGDSMAGWEEYGLRCAVVRIRLHTGRHHQIRVQMANAGMPLLGDRKYAGEAAAALSEELGIREIALCAYRLSFTHPRTGERMQFAIESEGAAFQKISREV